MTITEHGVNVFEETDSKLKDFYSNVLQKFGKEKIVQLLQLMKEFDSVMRTELEKWRITMKQVNEYMSELESSRRENDFIDRRYHEYYDEKYSHACFL